MRRARTEATGPRPEPAGGNPRHQLSQFRAADASDEEESELPIAPAGATQKGAKGVVYAPKNGADKVLKSILTVYTNY